MRRALPEGASGEGMTWALPEGAAQVLAALEAGGFEAYAVGGCVRDSLLGKIPHDWDVCTAALPEETKRCFPGYPVLETGIKHGTVTVLAGGEPYEVTTYRTDGGYSDGRRPDAVSFVRSLREDLARRDFTINAMAYSPVRGLVDLFGGREDLAGGILRCVGDPAVRFEEDALRILRALRFASVYGFRIGEQTAAAVRAEKGRLSAISAERIREELFGVLCGQGAAGVLSGYFAVFAEILPEITPMKGFSQRNPHHDSDVWEHTVRSVAAAPPDRNLRLAMLLHDIGKPSTFTVDEDGTGHFLGHAEAGAALARKLLRRLRCDNDTVDEVVELVLRHGVEPGGTPRLARRWLARMGETRYRKLLEAQRADALAQSLFARAEKLELLNRAQDTLERTLAEGACFRLADLAVNGRDLMAAGVPQGRQLGGILRELLSEVVEGTLMNDRAALLSRALTIQTE